MAKIFLPKSQNIVRSFESAKHHLSTYAQHYKPSHVGSNTNYIHSLSEGLSEAGKRAMQQAHKRFHEEMRQIMRDPANIGDIPSFSVAFCDTFTSNDMHARRTEEQQ